jgi:hypothetical protein
MVTVTVAGELGADVLVIGSNPRLLPSAWTRTPEAVSSATSCSDVDPDSAQTYACVHVRSGAVCPHDGWGI